MVVQMHADITEVPTNYGNVKADPRASKIPHGNLAREIPNAYEAVPKLTAALNRVRFRTK
jgi:hypothetical protein